MPSLLRNLFAGAAVVLACSCGGGGVTLPDVEAYPATGGGYSHKNFGYSFAVSPDEAWIATILQLVPRDRVPRDRVPRDHGQPDEYSLRLFHRASGKSWSIELLRSPRGWDFDDWFPACFSRDSSRAILGTIEVDLDPLREKLVTRPLRGMRDARETTFLDIPVQFQHPEKAVRTRNYLVLDQHAGQFGHVEHSARGSTRYESFLADGRVTLSVSPSPRKRRVDVSRVHAFELLRRAVTGLALLSVSPDGRYLAGVVTTGRAVNGVSVGVIIPLGSGRLVAHPYAERVYDKAVWSADSRSLYFYAQPGKSGQGPVHRLRIADLKALR